jgi:hypothetical protein
MSQPLTMLEALQYIRDCPVDGKLLDAISGMKQVASEAIEADRTCLAEATEDLLAACEFALTTPGMVKGRLEMEKAVKKARGMK